MSLLLEALKKAEKAKEDAQRRARGGDAGSEPPASAFDVDATVATDGKHVMRRDELPDISAPLEILSDDLRPAARARPAAPLELALTDTSSPAPSSERSAAPRRATPRAGSGTQAADPARSERAAAQKVFEAKFREPNPRLPFYIAMGTLGAFAVGTVAYFWIQLRPTAPLVNTNPARSASEKPVESGAEKSAAATPAATASTGLAAIPGLPGSAPPPPPAAAAVPAGSAVPAMPAIATPAPAVAAAPVAAATPIRAKPAAISAGATRSRSAAKGDESALSVNRGRPQIHPQVSAGYTAYQEGDMARARAAYLQVLREEPANRDAMLGLAAVEMREQRYDLSDAYYQRILRADPRDPHAQAGLLALRSQQLDPVLVESRVKSLLASDREANVLYFTLGNQYAQQARWAEAQQAYFKAFATDPDNADYAFNLAVSLDQLRQPKLALEYYRRALALAEKRSANFALEVARLRVQQLSR
ncbi:MAG: tetratricopeptide repeat protein [Betaproteobacteria bacterium]